MLRRAYVTDINRDSAFMRQLPNFSQRLDLILLHALLIDIPKPANI